jgi:hypothetical protein
VIQFTKRMQRLNIIPCNCSIVVIVAILMYTFTDSVIAESAATRPEQVTNKLLGQWARSAAECKRPEFTFNAATATIQLDADGTPISFDYPQVEYLLKDGRIIADLHKRHPIGKTASKTALEFFLQTDGSAELQMLKKRTLPLVRCPVSGTR